MSWPRPPATSASSASAGLLTKQPTKEMLPLLHWSLLLLLTQQSLGRAPKHGVRAAAERQQLCQWPCSCKPRAPCAPGVSSVLDGCGCCKSCARQIGEPCNERDVCDPHKGMYCDFSADRPRFQEGVCSYMMAVGCDLNGAHYENGEAFQPSPLYKCTCIGGAIGCSPAFIQKPAGLLGPASLSNNMPAGLRSGKAPNKHQQDTSYMSAWKKNCLVQSTAWSPCSKTCGLGISVRVNNDNGKCDMRKERRLCLLRPCDKKLMKGIKVPKGKTCLPKFQARKAERLVLSGCTSTKKLKPTFCGVCSDRRCCLPNKSRIITVNFSCKGGSSTKWKMQWITSCVCQRSCNLPGDMFSDLRLL